MVAGVLGNILFRPLERFGLLPLVNHHILDVIPIAPIEFGLALGQLFSQGFALVAFHSLKHTFKVSDSIFDFVDTLRVVDLVKHFLRNNFRIVDYPVCKESLIRSVILGNLLVIVPVNLCAR